MDDLLFRRSIYADPKCQDDAIKEAKNSDPAKKAFADEIELLDQKIASAMNVPVPDDLCNKLILRQTMASHQQHKRKNKVHLALAASVAIALGLSFNFMQFSSAYAGIGEYALAHVYHEENAFDNNASNSISLTALNNKMSSFDGSFTKTVGKLISADYCRFDGIKSLHLVYQGESSPVTVFIVPNRNELSFDAEFSDGKLRGDSKQYGETNVIVVGDKNESLNQWQSELSKNIRWST